MTIPIAAPSRVSHKAAFEKSFRPGQHLFCRWVQTEMSVQLNASFPVSASETGQAEKGPLRTFIDSCSRRPKARTDRKHPFVAHPTLKRLASGEFRADASAQSPTLLAKLTCWPFLEQLGPSARVCLFEQVDVFHAAGSKAPVVAAQLAPCGKHLSVQEVTDCEWYTTRSTSKPCLSR